jgi:predicted AlkP superfamily phosphohydrolase/phosphomutase
MIRSEPPLSPAPVWTTLVTGRTPDAHGIVFDAVKAPGRRLVPVTADRRRAPALWNIASARGITVGVAGWPAPWPAEPVKGFLNADALEPGRPAARGDFHPPGALGEGGEAGDIQLLDPRLTTEAEADPFIRQSFEEDLRTLSQALALQRVHQPRLLMIRLKSIDAIAHRFWQYHEPAYLPLAASRGQTIAAERARRLAGTVRAAHMFLDDCLGRLRARFPERTAWVVVSGWGMRGVRETDYLHVDLDALLARLEASGAASARGFFTLADTGRVPRTLHTEVDAPGVDRMAAALHGLSAEDGTPLFHRVTPAAGLPEDGLALEVIENLDIDPMAAVRIGDEAVEARGLFRRYGDDLAIHDPAGLILAEGDGVARGRSGWAGRMVDVLPTVLALLGLPQAEDLPGSPIDPLLADLSWREGSGVPTYRGIQPLPVPARRDPERVTREMQRLEASGHLR